MDTPKYGDWVNVWTDDRGTKTGVVVSVRNPKNVTVALWRSGFGPLRVTLEVHPNEHTRPAEVKRGAARRMLRLGRKHAMTKAASRALNELVAG